MRHWFHPIAGLRGARDHEDPSADRTEPSPCLEREVRELEARLRNPWRVSKGREGPLEAWG